MRAWDDGETQPSAVSGTAIKIENHGETEYAIAIHGGRGNYVVLDPKADPGVTSQITPQMIGQQVSITAQGVVTPSEPAQTLQRA